MYVDINNLIGRNVSVLQVYVLKRKNDFHSSGNGDRQPNGSCNNLIDSAAQTISTK